MQKIARLCILFFFLSSCIFGGAGSGQVQVKVAAFHENSPLRTASGQPYIRLSPSREICRWRPFQLQQVREQLLTEGIDEETLDDYLFYTEGEEATEEEGPGPEVRSPVYIETEDNWTKFGLQIVNLSRFALIIDTVRFNARARCGSQTFDHSGEISSGYCSESGHDAPFLYIVPPTNYDDKGRPIGPGINYQPRSINAFDNLTLIFNGFPIIDRTAEPSRNLQRAFQTVENNASNSRGQQNGSTAETECQPNQTIVIPRYTVELTLIGYFLLPRGTEQVSHFTKRIRFSTTVINL